MSDTAPRLFISYRWSSPEHEEWVLELATNLRSDGVDVILDKWHLREGQDTFVFMERMVNDPSVKKVLLICDNGYVARANARQGGVGTEAQIISNEVYSKVDQTKFAAAVRELDVEGKPLLPVYFLTRLYFDFSSEDAFSANYEKVLRWSFDKPFHPLPPLGTAPKYLESTFSVTPVLSRSASTFKAQRIHGDVSPVSVASILLDDIAEQAKALSLSLVDVSEADELVVQTVEQSIPLREQAFDAFDALLQSDMGEEQLTDVLHSFLEKINAHWDATPEQGRYTNIDNDALQFFVHSTFVGLIALALKRRKFSAIKTVLSLPLYRNGRTDRLGKGVHYGDMRPYLRSLEEIRKRRLNLNRISLHADYLKDSLNHSRVNLSDFMEADFTLYIRQLISELGTVNYPDWYPISLVWVSRSSGSFPTYVRAASRAFYNRFKPILGNLSAEELRAALAPYISGEKKLISVDYSTLDISQLANLDNIATGD